MQEKTTGKDGRGKDGRQQEGWTSEVCPHTVSSHSESSNSDISPGEHQNNPDLVILESARALHHTFIQNIPNRTLFLEDLYQQFRKAGADYTWFDKFLEPQEALYSSLRHFQHRILNTYGAGKEWNEIESYCRDVQELVQWTEDIQCFAIEGFVELNYAWLKGKLRYQQAP